jgi:hypothetical protein
MAANIISKTKEYSLIIILLVVLTSCKKLVEVDPPVSLITGREAFANNTSAIAVVNSIYSFMSQYSSGNFAQGQYSIGMLTAVGGDELWLRRVSNNHFDQFYKNSLTPENFYDRYFWYDLYTNLYTCNVVLEKMPSATGIREDIKKQLLAEVKFMRAFHYFYLVNLFGDVPLATTTDFRINNALGRTPVAQVYNLILQDLKEALTELSPDFVDGYLKKATERIRPTKWAAAALLARVFLYLNDWAAAETHATTLIAHSEFLLESDLDRVFLIPSKEAILQLQPLAGENTTDGQYYTYRFPAFSPAFSLDSRLIASFDSGDVRLKNWVGQTVVPASGSIPTETYLRPFKYKMGRSSATTEYIMVLRLAEQYLIRAEARAQQNNLAGAKTDLDAIRLRAGLPGVTVTTKEAMLQAIAKNDKWSYLPSGATAGLI